MMLARARRGAGFFRTIFYLPALAPPVAATLAFVYILNPATGPVNILLKHLGIEGPLWFQSPGWSKPSLVLLGLWGVGNIMIIFLAAILDVPKHLYESAELDGAGPLQRMRWVTLPTISPVILFSVVIGVIAGLQYFTQAYVAANVAVRPGLAGGRPDGQQPRLPGGARRSSIPCCSTSTGSATSTWATRRRCRCCCSSSRSPITVLIIRNSRRWVHYVGSAK